MSKQALVKNEEIPDENGLSSLGGETAPNPPSYDPGQEYPYTHQPPAYQPNPGQYPVQVVPGQYAGQDTPVQTYIYPSIQHVSPVTGVSDYLALNLLVLIFCCLPIGIYGVIKSSECKTAIATGDQRKAERLSSEAKKIAIMGCGCGSFFLVAVIIFYIVLYSQIGLI